MPDMLLLPQMRLLLSNSHRTIIQKRAYNVIVAIYTQLHELTQVNNENEENKEQIMIFTKTPAQIKEILKIE